MVVHTAAVTSQFHELTNEYPRLFKSLGKLNHLYTIQLCPDAGHSSHASNQELDRMEELRVTARVEQLTDWCAHMVVVPKENGKFASA